MSPKYQSIKQLILSTCLLIFLLCNAVYSQTIQGKDLKFDRIDVQEGLSQGSVLCLYQDSFGFVWVGTRDGLNRYDGYVFEVFKHHVRQKESIGGNIVSDIKEDKLGNIWVVTENGLSYFDRKTGYFKNFSLPKNQYDVTAFNALLVDELGRVWIGGKYGLFHFDIEKETFYREENQDFQLMGMVSALEGDSDGNVYVGTTKLGLYKVDKRLKSEKIAIKSESSLSSRVETIHIKGENIWVGTYGSGLLEIDKNGNVLNHYSSNSSDPNMSLSNNNVRDILTDLEGNTWVGTFDGLNIIDKSGRNVKIEPIEADPKSLAHSSVRSLLLDRKGSVWVGTYMGGINLFDQNNQRFKHAYYRPSMQGSLSYNVVGAFAESSDGEIIIGTERGGLNLYGSDRMHQVIGDGQATIKSLHVAKDGRVWSGVFRKGLNLINLKSGTSTSYPKSDQKEYSFLNKAIINSIVEVQGGLWIATDDRGGLFFFNTKTLQFENFKGGEELQDFLSNYSVKSIATLEDGKLLLATKGRGVVFFDSYTGDFTSYSNIEIDGELIQADEFNHCFVSKSGEFWLSSNGEGVFRFDPKTNGFFRYHAEDGLSNNIVLGTVQDDSEDLWFVCYNGLTKLEQNSKIISFKNYKYSSGFPLEEINEGAFFKTKNGDFLIGGSNGYVNFNPKSLFDNNFIPPIVITDLSVSNQRVSPLDETKILEESIYKTQKITLSYYQSILTLDFAALNFIRPENNQYAYQLEGFDPDWVYSSGRRSVTYTNLPDGTYTFLVKGSNNDGVWNDVPTSLEIVILPPPWKTWWAMCIYAFMIVGGFLLIRYNAVKSTQLKSTLKLEQLEKEKWKEIHDLKLKYFIDVSHEFRTPLTLILSPLEEIIATKTGDFWLKSRLKIMLFNSKRLLHLIDQILEIREIETGHHTLNPKPLFLSELMEEVVGSFKGLADKQKIKLEFQLIDVPEEALMIDQDKVEKILFNLLSNAFKFTPAGGEISVLVSRVENGYHFSIRDTGKGIGKEVLPKVFDRFFKEGKGQYGAGIGLSLTHSLVEVLGGEITVHSELGKGSKFDLVLDFMPYKKGVDIVESPKPFVKPIPLEYQHTTLIASPEINNDPNKEKQLLLIVEDNVELKDYLKAQFKKSYDVVTAKNGVSGLKKAIEKGPSLIISDVMMPEMDGYEFCKSIKSNPILSHIPIVLLTAKNAQQNKLEGLEHGADDYISKPFNIIELKAKVKSILHNRKLLQEKYLKGGTNPEFKTKISCQDELLMDKVYKAILGQLDKPNLTVDSLGEDVGLSRVHLFRKLKAMTGLSPSDLIKDLRMKEAKKMLSSGKFRVADVAYAVGFQDVAYFGKVFKKHYGQSPKEFKTEED